jgi:hypothetical protein
MSLGIFATLIDQIEKFEFGEKVEFTSNSLPLIPELIEDHEIYIESRQRFTSNGLIDNIIIYLTKKSAIGLGLWILAAYFQRSKGKYILRLENAKTTVREIWIDFTDKTNVFHTSKIIMNLEKFDWIATNVEKFAASHESYFNQNIEVFLSNETENWLSMDEFNARNILIGFGAIGGGISMAEFLLNFGLTPSDINYEYIKYEFSRRSLADESSCEIRAQLVQSSTTGLSIN